MAVLIDAISIKRRTLFEFENIPFVCLKADVSTLTARGGQTLVRVKNPPRRKPDWTQYFRASMESCAS